MKKIMMMTAGFATVVAVVTQDAAASTSADWFPVSICLTMARPIPPFPCDNVAGLSLCLLSGEDCPVYGLQASCLSGCAEAIYGVQIGAGYQCADDVYGLQIGGVNVTTNLWGVQVGGLNGMRGCGFQVGALNIVDQTSSVVQIGAMNSHFWKMDATQSSRKSLILKSRPDGSCAHLTEDNLCRINSVKPEKCRTFPFEWTNPDSAEVCPGLAGQRGGG